MAIYGNHINQYSISLDEDYNIEEEYELYLAEDKLFKTIFSMTILEDSIITESVLLEGVKDAIMGFIDKIIGAIQNVWNKFKKWMLDSGDDRYLESIKNDIPKFKGTVTVKNYHQLDLSDNSKFTNIKVIPWSDEVKNHLNTEEDFVKQYYPDLMNVQTDQGKEINSVTDKVRTLCTTVKDAIQVNVADVYTSATITYNNLYKNIEQDLKTVNTSYTNIKAFINSTYNGNENNNQPQQTSQNASYRFKFKNYESLNEDNVAQNANAVQNSQKLNQPQQQSTQGDNNKQNQVEVDSDGDGTPDKNEKDKEAANTASKQVKVYFSATCKILTAKLTVLRDFRKQNVQILKSVFKQEKEAKKNEENNNTTVGVQV